MNKILVLGCGSIGSRHAANAAKLGPVGVFDNNFDRARTVAENVGGLFFPNLEEALAWKPDGVVVATPHASHIALATQAVASGCHVLIEKPISDHLEGVAAFLDYAESLERKVFVVCNLRFHPGVVALREHFTEIGRPLFARAQYGNYLPDMRPGADYRELYCSHANQGGGVVLDSVHEIDYLSWLFGPPEEIKASVARLGTLDIDVEDYGVMFIKHQSGVRSEIHVDYLQRVKRRGCEIVGSEGTLIWTSEGKKPENLRVAIYRSRTREWAEVLRINSVDASLQYMAIMQRFTAAVAGESIPDLLDGRDALLTLGIALAAKAGAGTS